MAIDRLICTTLRAKTDLSGVIGDIDDDPDSPDANWMTATNNNVNTDVRVKFEVPSGSPTVGADKQEFRALVRKDAASGTGDPNARIELWEDDILIRAGSDAPVTSTSGEVIAFTWNANELSDSTGLGVQCKVVGTKSGGSPTARSAVDVGAIEWNAEHDPPSFITGSTSVGAVVTGDLANAPGGAITGTASVGATATADLDGLGLLDGTVLVEAAGSANLSAVGSLAATAVVGAIATGDLVDVSESASVGAVFMGMNF